MSLKASGLLGVLAVVTLMVAACSSDPTDTPATDPSPTSTADPTTTTIESAATTMADSTPINHLQSLGSHNSYHIAPSGPVAVALDLVPGDYADALDYSHATVTEQLEDFGLRHLEFDVFADPDGGHFANRSLLGIIDLPMDSGLPEIDEPGFKVMHIQDIDFESTCSLLVSCLDEVAVWSSANPDHAPLLIVIEVKSESLEEGAAELGIDIGSLGPELPDPLDMTPALYADLEAEALSVFPPEQIITPDEIRGNHATLDEAVRSVGWPALGDARGKVMIALFGSAEDLDVYRAGAPSLERKLFFTTSDVGDPHGAIVRFDDPIDEAAQIAEALAAGYLVRTRADADTVEARAGDTTRRDAALASGAQFVSTDFYEERVDFGTGYVVVLPGDVPVRCNPVTAGTDCSDPVG